MSKKRVLLSWSSGKDSTYTLHTLLQDERYEVIGLFTTINQISNRVAIHGVRTSLLKQQAKEVNLPLTIIDLPFPCTNIDYEEIMGNFIENCKNQRIDCFAFGDLFLEDIRDYRIKNLDGTGIEPIFPIWGLDTHTLPHRMFDVGIKAKISSIDPKALSDEFVGLEYDQSFLSKLPDGADLCGENGEFHTFVYDANIFSNTIPIKTGEIIHANGGVFCDLIEKE
ncbi:adenine nucleotide alpha hydrolase [Vibrio sp.]|nr:adenine nucleotide alpha hydrolase [Vibrio sp.]